MDQYIFLQAKPSKFTDLHFCYCGYEKCVKLHSWGPAVRPNYLLHYVVSGKGSYQVGDRSYELTGGDGFLIEPGRQCFYQADSEDPWTYLWMGFDGRLAAECVEHMGLGGDKVTFKCAHGRELRDIIFEILRNNHSTEANDLLIQGLMYQFLSIMLRDSEVITHETSKDNSYVRKAIEYIQNNYSSPIHVTDIAEYVNLNRGYLYTLFKSEVNMSPQQYLMTFRLTRAAELLNTTDYSVESIAISCGYRDPAVFTKAFKRMHGLSPLKYRQNTSMKSRLSLNKGLDMFGSPDGGE
jgi:AraC-like DNA-binding protein